MDELHSRIAVRDRILNELRNIIKQIYYDSMNYESNPENKTYLCMILIKTLDEALSHGLKQLHLGHWKAIQSILHPEFLSELEKLPKYSGSECNFLNKGRTWIAVALKEDCFVNYIHCLLRESCISKFYENWSIIRNNDSCNRFVSLLSGLGNINFTFQTDFINKPPSICTFNAKLIKDQDLESRWKSLSTSKCSINLTTSSSSLTSPVDSGVHIQDSTSDMEQLPEDNKSIDIDFLNGNIPESVTRRKNKKDTKRHVSFHEDIIYKSPDKCRKLKWDCENLRYSWSGEELDSSILLDTNFSDIKSQMTAANQLNTLDINERGVPEGEETPCNLENLKRISKTQKSVIVKRFLQSINNQSKIKQLSKKYSNVIPPYQFFNVKIDKDVVSEINREIKNEYDIHWKATVSKYDTALNKDIIRQMTKNEIIYKSYKLRDYLFILTDANIYCINSGLEMKKIELDCVKEVLIYPDSHIFWLWESKDKCHKFVTCEEELTHHLMARLELCMRRNHLNLPQFHTLHHSDLHLLKRQLTSRYVISKHENFVYCGLIKLEREAESLAGSTGTSMRGFLMYRDQRGGDNWMPGYFQLKGNILYLYSDGFTLPKFAINLPETCRSCNRTSNSGRPHTFQITVSEEDDDFPSDDSCFYQDKSKSKLLKSDTHKLFLEIRHKMNKLLNFGNQSESAVVLELAAANEQELSDWLQMIVQASCGDYGEDASRDNIIDGTLILTEDSLIITNELFSGGQIEILSRAQISDIAGFRMGRDPGDLFALIEFSCIEATVNSGDWIIYMSSRDELEKLGVILQRLWVSGANYPGGILTEERLINRCRKTQAALHKNYWTHLLQ